jgi:hypothetical protein
MVHQVSRGVKVEYVEIECLLKVMLSRDSRGLTVDRSPCMERECHTRSFGEGSHKLLRLLGLSRQTAVQARMGHRERKYGEDFEESTKRLTKHGPSESSTISACLF